jgi:hypothetical protein
MPLDLKRRPKSPYWIIRGSLRGYRVEESTGTSDKRIAEEILAKRQAEILEQSVYGRRATETFANAALSYLQQGGSKRFTAAVISHFGTTPLAKIDQDALDRGAKKLYPNASPSTRNRQFYAIASSIDPASRCKARMVFVANYRKTLDPSWPDSVAYNR